MTRTKKRAARLRVRRLGERLRRAVAKGTDAMEEMHKKVVDLPLDVLERNGVFEETARRMRRRQDRAIGAMYDFFRDVNRRMVRFARGPRASRRPRARRKAQPKPKAATATA